jgi:hypothetical protein
MGLPLQLTPAVLKRSPWTVDISCPKRGISAPTGRRIPAQGATLGRRSPPVRRSEGTPWTLDILLPKKGPFSQGLRSMMYRKS